MLEDGFIKPTRYAEQISNIMLILKKNGKLRVYLDFINLNFTTSNDKYPMSMTNISIIQQQGMTSLAL